MAKTKAYILSEYAERLGFPKGERIRIRCVIWAEGGRVLVVTENPETAVMVNDSWITVTGGMLKELMLDRDNAHLDILEHCLKSCLESAPKEVHDKGQITKHIRKKKGLPKRDAQRYAEIIRKIRLFEATKEHEDIKPIELGEHSQDDLVFHEDLFGYQRKAITAIVKNEQNILLNDPMGAGKTVQSIYSMINIDDWPVLIVCPSSVKYNWKHEILDWVPGSEGNISVVEGQSGPYEAKKWTIINWAILHHRAEGLNKVDWGGIIGDELHYAKNTDAKRSKAMVALAGSGDQKVLGLTGTPVMNRPSELYNQLQILQHPLGDMGFYDFCRRFCGGYRAPYGFETDYLPNARLNDLSEAISNVLIKRERRDILSDLPPLRRGWHHVEVTKDGRGKHADIMAKIKAEYEKLEKRSEAEQNIVGYIQQMRMASALGKAPAVAEMLNETVSNNHQVLLFSDFKEPMDLLQERLDNHDWGIERITGDTSDNKYEISERFNDDDHNTRLILATSAAETGINLTGADEVWNLSLNWNPMSHRQREDRALRIGRENPVLSRYFESNLGIDKAIAEILQDKLDTVNEVIGTADEDHFTEDRDEKTDLMQIVDSIV